MSRAWWPRRMRVWEPEVRVLIVVNIANADAVVQASRVAGWLVAEGFQPILTTGDARGTGLEEYAVSPSEVGEPLLAVALGGDGTILKAVHILGEAEVPLLGINLGRLGFLSGASGENILDAISSALAGEARIERRATLIAEVVMGGRPVGRYRALNEVALVRGATGRVVEIETSVNGLRVQTMRCDGLIVATPTGSTAYALSAGGPIASPEVECMLVVPVAAHTLAARALVLGSHDVVELRMPDPIRGGARLQIDGDVLPGRQEIESLTVRRAATDVLLARLDGRDFFEVVRQEFLGA